MVDSWLLGLRWTGLALAGFMGALILLKSRHWRDPALIWLLMGLSVGPMIVLGWNLFYRLWLSDLVAPTARLDGGPLANVQFRYLYGIINQALNFLCILAVAIGIAKLYRKARQRVQLLPAHKATTNDPRN